MSTAAPRGTIFPADTDNPALFGRVKLDGDIEYGFLKADNYGKLRWINQQDAATEKREV